MESKMCQCSFVPRLSEGTRCVLPPSLKRWLKLKLKRSLGGSTTQMPKMHSDHLAQSINNLVGRSNAPPVVETVPKRASLASGDLVRVRSEEEIRATLNARNELEGCMFVDAQRQYCGTTQRVLKPMERFVDERNYRVKRAKGVLLRMGLCARGRWTMTVVTGPVSISGEKSGWKRLTEGKNL